MFYTPLYYLDSAVAYRQERLARDWKAANRRNRNNARPRRRLRLPRRPHLRLPRRQLGTTVVA